MSPSFSPISVASSCRVSKAAPAPPRMSDFTSFNSVMIFEADHVSPVPVEASLIPVALSRLPQAVEFEANVAQAEFPPQGVCQQNEFGVDLCAGESQNFCANLVKLAVASALGAFMAKHRTHVVETLSTLIQH